MLNSLLETIATLGILVSLAAKFGKPSLDAMAISAEGEITVAKAVSPERDGQVDLAGEQKVPHVVVEVNGKKR